MSRTMASRARLIIALTLGNAFEWYDFTLYGLFSATIARLFFPLESESARMLATAASIGVAFLLRPVGGVLFGLYADRVGRKTALSLMVVMMAFGTGLIGLAPTYAAIGLGAPVLVLCARMIQGFSAGGEFGSAVAFLVESAPPGRRGLYGGFQMCSQMLSVAVAAGAVYLLHAYISTESLNTWAWRLPFLFGILVGPVGFYIRQKLEESPELLAYRQQQETSQRTAFAQPLQSIVRNHPAALITGIGLTMASTASFYITWIYLPLQAVTAAHMPQTTVSAAIVVCSLLIVVASPLIGHLSDTFSWSRIRLVLCSIVLYAAMATLGYLQWRNQPSAENFWLMMGLQAAAMSLANGVYPTAMAELFPVQLRATGLSVTYNLAVALFGGLAPFWITLLVEKVTSLGMLYYVAVLSVLSFVLVMEGHKRVEAQRRMATLEASAGTQGR